MKKNAFSLVELLVSVAIVALLCGLLFGTHAVAKRHAFQTTNLVRLRQIGVALELYAQDHGAMPHRSLQTIVNSKYLKDVRLLDSPLDSFESGYANHVDSCMGDGTVFGGKAVQSDIHAFRPWPKAPSMYEHMKQWNDSPGLAVDFSIGSKVNRGCFYEFAGRYHRLQGDLSVVVRERQVRSTGGPGTYGTDYRTLFIDELPDENWGKPY